MSGRAAGVATTGSAAGGAEAATAGAGTATGAGSRTTSGVAGFGTVVAGSATGTRAVTAGTGRPLGALVAFCFAANRCLFNRAASATLIGCSGATTASGCGFGVSTFAGAETMAPGFRFWHTILPSMTSSGPTKFPAASSVRQFTSLVSWAKRRAGVAAISHTTNSWRFIELLLRTITQASASDPRVSIGIRSRLLNLSCS